MIRARICMNKRNALRIRRAVAQDADRIYRLGKQISELGFSKKYPFHERAELREFVKTPRDNILLVAVNGRELIGFLYARILAHCARGWCMLDNLAVKKQYRKKGIATNLLEKLYKELKKRKISYIQILESTSKETRKFWRDEGFKETNVFVWAEKEI